MQTSIYRNLDIINDSALPYLGAEYQKVYLSEQEPRFRSILEQTDFLLRYPDTDSNHNRKRASYVLSTFFCEQIAPSEPSPELPHGDDEHGSNPNCLGCHYRLDPLSRYFDQWPPADTLSKLRFDGAFDAIGALMVLDGEDRRLYRGQSIRELSESIVKDPRFYQCVSQKAWQFVFGREILGDEATFAKLGKNLQEHKRVNQLMGELIQHPYFWSDASPTSITFAQIKEQFRVCAGCHKADRGPLPRFPPMEYPYLPDPQANGEFLKRVYRAALGLPGAKAMPPAPIPPMSAQQKSQFTFWIKEGGHGENGPTLTNEQIQFILGD